VKDVYQSEMCSFLNAALLLLRFANFQISKLKCLSKARVFDFPASLIAETDRARDRKKMKTARLIPHPQIIPSHMQITDSPLYALHMEFQVLPFYSTFIFPCLTSVGTVRASPSTR
jgi:hypothetical protein